MSDTTQPKTHIIGGKFPATLPYGIEINGETVRDFSVLTVDGHFERVYTHQSYAAKHPQKWTSRLVAAVLESIGNVDVRTQFKAKEFKDPPEIINKLAIVDVGYILLCGHINTYGLKIQDVEQRCPSCTKTNEFSCDLSDIEVLHDVEPAKSFEVLLPDGFTRDERAADKGAMKLGFEGYKLNKVTFDVPRLGHAIKNEPYYSMENMAEFNLRIAQSAIIAISAVEVDAETGETTTLLELDQEQINIVRPQFILKLLGRDRKEIRRRFKEMDTCRLEVEKECLGCGADLTVSISAGDLYPLA